MSDQLTAVERSLAALTVLASCAAWGCGQTTVTVEPSALPWMVPAMQRVSEGETVVVDTNQGPRAITPRNDPSWRIELERSCSIGQTLAYECDKLIAAKAEQVTIKGTHLRITSTTSVLLGHERIVDADLSEVKKSKVLLMYMDPAGWRPVWGFGLAVGGPGGLGGVQAQVLAYDWLAVEAGFFPAADLAAFHAGFRSRPLAIGPIRPFLGWFVSAAAAFNGQSGESASMSAIGPRVGLDWALARGHWLLTFELDAPHPLAKDHGYWGDLHGRWIGWGGAAATYFL